MSKTIGKMTYLGIYIIYNDIRQCIWLGR